MNDVSRVHKVQQLYIDFLHIIPGINDTAACGLVIEPLKLLDVDRKIGIIGSSGFNFHRIEFAVRRLQQTLYKIFCQLKSTVYLLQRASRTWSVLTIDEDVTCTPSLVNHPKKVGTAAVSTEEEE